MLNIIWIAFFVSAFLMALYRALVLGDGGVWTELVNSVFVSSKAAFSIALNLTGIKVDYTSVIRHRRTKPQVQFSGHARISNVKNAFSVRHPERLKNKRIVLIDDVMTTGSTLKECALAMKKAGVKSVDTLTVARVC